MSDQKKQCNCFQDLLEKVKSHLKDKIPEDATEFEANWENSALILSSGDYSSVNPRINYSYRKVKRDGTNAKSLTRNSVSVFCDYCPFCGRKYEKEGKEAA
ncbi:MAG: hypothetical protein ACK5M8_22060 [Shewanella algae]